MNLNACSFQGRVGVTNTNMAASSSGSGIATDGSRRWFFGRLPVRVTCNKGDGVVKRPSTAPRPSALPSGSGQQLRIPTPRELERMRQFRQQQQLRQQQLHQQGTQLHDSGSADHRPATAIKARSRRAPEQPDEAGMLDRNVYAQLAQELGLEPSWRPQVSLLHQVGLRGPDLAKLAEARPEVFVIKPPTMRRKIKFLQEVVGLSDEDLAKVLTKFPRILEYQMERTLRPRLDFLRRCGVPDEDVSKVVVKAPMVLELSVEDTLQPRAAFLCEQLGLREGELGKLVMRHPQILTCTEDMMAQRVAFLREHGLGQQQMGKAVLAHPQVLHYKIESMRERVSYLLSVGMTPQQVAASVCRFPQLFSLSVESNLAPKWRYLVEHLGGDVRTLCAYPAYLSLSLTNRIIPRHRYWQRCKPDAGLPFPMTYLKCADKRFAADVCGGSLVEYEEFKAGLEAERVQQEEQAAAGVQQAQRQAQQQPGNGAVRAQPGLQTPRQPQPQPAPGRAPPASSNGVVVTQLGPALRRVSRGSAPPAQLPAGSGGGRAGMPAQNSVPRISTLGTRRLMAGAGPSSMRSLDGSLQGYSMLVEPPGQAQQAQQQGATAAAGADLTPPAAQGDKAWAGGLDVASNGLPLRGRVAVIAAGGLRRVRSRAGAMPGGVLPPDATKHTPAP